MKLPLSPSHLLTAAIATVAVGLSSFVLSGGGGSALPAVPRLPAEVVAASRIASALAVPLPSRAAPGRPAYATAPVVNTAPTVHTAQRPQPAERPAIKHPRRVVVRHRAAPVVAVTPASVTAPAAPAKTALWKKIKDRGRSSLRSKGRRAIEVRRDHQKPKPERPSAPAGRHGANGNHGGNGGGNGHRGGK
jgi:hypothetical protein